MGTLKTPPDATQFRSGGVDYFLYMGPLEMRELQRELGLIRRAADTPEAWMEKCVLFADMLNGGIMYGMEEKIPVFRHALSRWADAAGVDRATLTDERVAEIVGAAGRGRRKKGKAGYVYAAELFAQFMADCFAEDEEELPQEEATEDGDSPRPKGRSRKTEVSAPSST